MAHRGFDENEDKVFETMLVCEDYTLDHLSPSHRQQLAKMMERRNGLHEAVDALHTTVRRSHALVARSRGRPRLAVVKGKMV